MYKVKGLAWDDEPEEYMNKLQSRLKQYHVGLEIEDDYGRFLAKFDPTLYDFVVLDVFDDTDQRAGDGEVGTRLAEKVAAAVHDRPWFPIFVVTGKLNRLLPESFANLPQNALLRYKADAVFIARLIKDDLVRRGVFISRRKVFLIRQTNHTHPLEVEQWLKKSPLNLEVEVVSPSTTFTDIVASIRKKMNECAAIVAVCTPDEQLASGVWRTRPNITLEIGMAISLPRGLERLTIVKPKSVERPSDLGGVLTLDYEYSPSEVFGDLEARLKAIGVDLNLNS